MAAKSENSKFSNIKENYTTFLMTTCVGYPESHKCLTVFLLFQKNTLSLQEEMTCEDLSVCRRGQPQSAPFIWGTEKAPPLPNGS